MRLPAPGKRQHREIAWTRWRQPSRLVRRVGEIVQPVRPFREVHDITGRELLVALRRAHGRCTGKDEEHLLDAVVHVQRASGRAGRSSRREAPRMSAPNGCPNQRARTSSLTSSQGSSARKFKRCMAPPFQVAAGTEEIIRARPILERCHRSRFGRSRRRGPACPRRAGLHAYLQRRLHGLAGRAEAPHPRRLRDVRQPDHEMAFGDAGAAGRLPQGDRHPPERRLGPPPRLRHGGRHGPGGDAGLDTQPAQGTRSQRKDQHRPLPLLARRAVRRARGESRGGAGDRPDVPGFLAHAPRGAGDGGREDASTSTRFGPAGSSPP